MHSERRLHRKLVRSGLASLIVGLLSTSAFATVVERIVAVVDGRPLLLSDALLLTKVRGLAEDAAISALVDEHLMYREAARLPQASVSEAERQVGLESLLLGNADLTRIGGEAALRTLVQRQVTILKYVELRFRPQIRISDAELQQAWDQESAAPFGSPPPREEARRLRERLQRAALDQKIESWIRDLRAEADIRYNRP
jgi:hypothetical protein